MSSSILVAGIPNNLLSMASALRAVAASRNSVRAYSANPERTIDSLLQQENMIVHEINKLEKMMGYWMDREIGEQCLNPGKSYSYEIKVCAEKRENLRKKHDSVTKKISKKIEEMYDQKDEESHLLKNLGVLDSQYQVACREEDDGFDFTRFDIERRILCEKIDALKKERYSNPRG